MGRRGARKRNEQGEGKGREMVERERKRGWIRLRSAAAADPGNSDGVGPKALSVAGKPPRSDNTLYIAGNLNPVRVSRRVESRSDKSVSLLVIVWAS